MTRHCYSATKTTVSPHHLNGYLESIKGTVRTPSAALGHVYQYHLRTTHLESRSYTDSLATSKSKIGAQDELKRDLFRSGSHLTLDGPSSQILRSQRYPPILLRVRHYMSSVIDSRSLCELQHSYEDVAYVYVYKGIYMASHRGRQLRLICRSSDPST